MTREQKRWSKARSPQRLRSGRGAGMAPKPGPGSRLRGFGCVNEGGRRRAGEQGWKPLRRGLTPVSRRKARREDRSGFGREGVPKGRPLSDGVRRYPACRVGFKRCGSCGCEHCCPTNTWSSRHRTAASADWSASGLAPVAGRSGAGVPGESQGATLAGGVSNPSPM